jgi:S1-C subfamily serine protease
VVAAALALAIVGSSAAVPPAVQGVVPQVVEVWSVEGAGSGFPVSQDLVVTALHVTDDRTGAQLRLQDGSVVGGQVIAVSKAHDLALIQANQPLFEPVSLASVGPTLSMGVWAMGDPPDDGQGALVRAGSCVSGVAGLSGYLSFTADVRHGFSGGPLVNERGEVIGVIDAKTSDGQGLAVPVDAVIALIADGGDDRVPSARSPWGPLVLIAVVALGGVFFARRESRKGEVSVRLGPVREAAAFSPRLEER